MSYPDGGGLFKAEAKQPIDVVVRRHDYAVGSSTGWHAHPYPVFITVMSRGGHVLRVQRPDLHSHVVSAGQGYVDSGEGHIGRNESGPGRRHQRDHGAVGAVFRAELPAPGPFCAF